MDDNYDHYNSKKATYVDGYDNEDDADDDYEFIEEADEEYDSSQQVLFVEFFI